ncbi:MAG: ABC transporter permease subunit [Candidatus Promineifilaceae bacterium]
MNIYKHEFRMGFRSMVTWSIAVIAIIFLMMSIFSSFAEDAALMEETLASFPPELLAAFGMTDLDMASVLGYFSFIFVFVQICLAIQAANYGFSLVSVEERELTADFLLAKPVGRNQIMTSKLLSALTALAITNIVVWITSLAAINLFRDGREYDVQALVLLLLSVALFQLFFLSVGLVISLLVRRVRNVTPYSMALVFGMYVLNAFGNMLGEDTFELLSPFRHFEPSYITSNGAYDPLILLSLVITVVSIAGSYLLYARRNIAAPV